MWTVVDSKPLPLGCSSLAKNKRFTAGPALSLVLSRQAYHSFWARS